MDNHEASRFARILFETAPDDFWVLLWTSHDKRSHWFPVGDWEGIADLADALSAGSGPVNVYIGAGLLPDGLGPKSRGSAEQRVGIPGVWADIDYGDDGHQKSDLPANIGGAWQIINDLPLPPTMVVHSGHGLQAWWLFHEFWTFEHLGEWDRAAALVRGWNATVRATAGKHGWTVDSTFDLARVMRLPGTYNTKQPPAVPVTISQADPETRYSPEDIAAYVQDETAPKGDSGAPRDVSLSGLPSAPPPRKFSALYTNDEVFRDLYEHRRRLKDDSPSAYDMALANLAVRAGWSDDEIAGLLVAHRVEIVKQSPKHKGYYEVTIGKARSQLAGDDVDAEIDALYQEMVKAHSPPDRDKTLEIISKQIGIKITGFIVVTTTPPSYRLETERGSVEIEKSRGLRVQTEFQEKIMDVARFMPKSVKSDPWNKTVNLLLGIAEERDGGDENREEGSTTAWIQSYLDFRATPPDWDTVLERMDTLSDVIKAKAPFRDQHGRLCIFSSDLRKFLLNEGERIDPPKLAARLSHVGCESDKINTTRESGRTSTSVWVIPESLLYRNFSDA